MSTAPTPAPSSEPAPARAAKRSRSSRNSLKQMRRRSREIALQGLYEWLVSKSAPAEIDKHMREQEGFGECDSAHFDALLHGCIGEAADIDGRLARHLDRKTALLSPIEHGALMIGVYELAHCIDVPYKVVINEAVELAKEFGGTDGHKYVNGVLDKTAAELRVPEVEAARAARRG